MGLLLILLFLNSQEPVKKDTIDLKEKLKEQKQLSMKLDTIIKKDTLK